MNSAFLLLFGGVIGGLLVIVPFVVSIIAKHRKSARPEMKTPEHASVW
jgi:hypothetical protein